MPKPKKIIFILLGTSLLALQIGMLLSRRIYDPKGASELYGLCYMGSTIVHYKAKAGYYPFSDGGKLPKYIFRKKNVDELLSSYVCKTTDITNNHGFDSYWVGLNKIYEIGSGDDKSYPDYKDASAKYKRPVIPAGMPESMPRMVT